MMKYRRHSSKLIQQALPCPGGVHCTYLLSFASEKQIKLLVTDPPLKTFKRFCLFLDYNKGLLRSSKPY